MVIFDSSTLILLAKSELLDLFLKDYGGKVVIPAEVEAESCGGKECFDALIIRARIMDKRVTVIRTSDVALCRTLMRDFRIGKGEAEALVLAVENKARIVATDDKNAIKACKLLKLPFTSAMPILIRLAEKKLIDPERAEIALAKLVRYGRYSDEIIEMAREKMKKG